MGEARPRGRRWAEEGASRAGRPCSHGAMLPRAAQPTRESFNSRGGFVSHGSQTPLFVQVTRHCGLWDQAREEEAVLPTWAAPPVSANPEPHS